MEELSLKPTVVDSCDVKDGSSVSPLSEDSPETALPIPSLVVDPPPLSKAPALLVEPREGSSEDASRIPGSPLDGAFRFSNMYVVPTKSVTPEQNNLPAFDSSQQTHVACHLNQENMLRRDINKWDFTLSPDELNWRLKWASLRSLMIPLGSVYEAFTSEIGPPFSIHLG